MNAPPDARQLAEWLTFDTSLTWETTKTLTGDEVAVIAAPRGECHVYGRDEFRGYTMRWKRSDDPDRKVHYEEFESADAMRRFLLTRPGVWSKLRRYGKGPAS